MKSRIVIIGLVVAAAGLAGWVVRNGFLLAEKQGEIAALTKWGEAARQDAEAARSSGKAAGATASEAPGTGDGNMMAATIPATALEKALDLPAGAGRDRAIRAALAAMAASDPQKAWDHAQNLPDEPSGSRMETSKEIIKVWSMRDPATAAAMLATLPPAWSAELSGSAKNATGVIESVWIKQDPPAALQWLNSLPAGNARDSAIMGLVAVAGAEEAPAAFALAGTMIAPHTRDDTVERIVVKWAQLDPAAAAQAVQAQYPDARNGRRAILLAIVQAMDPNSPKRVRAAPEGGAAP